MTIASRVTFKCELCLRRVSYKDVRQPTHVYGYRLQATSIWYPASVNCFKVESDAALLPSLSFGIENSAVSRKYGRACYILHSSVILTFSWGGQIFLLFFNATGQLKIWKKQHFICSNLTLFIVPFFLSFFFLSFFFFFLFFFLFFFFSFSLGEGGGDDPPGPSPLKWRPCYYSDLRGQKENVTFERYEYKLWQILWIWRRWWRR